MKINDISVSDINNNELTVRKYGIFPLQEKNVTENGSVVADSKFYGLSKVNVNVQGGNGSSANFSTDMPSWLEESINHIGGAIAPNGAKIYMYLYSNNKTVCFVGDGSSPFNGLANGTITDFSFILSYGDDIICVGSVVNDR